MTPAEVSALISGSGITSTLAALCRKILKGGRILPGEGLMLFEEAPLGLLGTLAEFVRARKNGNRVYFIRNFHIEPTNVCVNKCRFCSFSHHFSKNQWELTLDEILDRIASDGPGAAEVHITGAVHPKRDLYYYGEILKEIRKRQPGLHIKAYSAVELDYMIRKAGLSFGEGLEYLKSCGLDSIPGGGAEIFDEAIRQDICGMKSSSSDWLQIHETAHRLGIPSNATMLYGHVETYTHRIDHLERLRRLQDRTRGFQAFIPLKFRNWNNEMEQLPELPVTDDMRNYAVSRIYLDNFEHLKAYWPAIGKQNAILSLSFGVDDLDGTINDSTRIYSLAGAEEQNPAMTSAEMNSLILGAGRVPVERDSLYHPMG
jgi:aminodeoxyfutalosine synthase